MGVSMADCRAGTIVWVLRKNGSWWPGRVVSPSELPCSSWRKSGATPVKLLGKENASVDWFNLEKSKRIKAFRCGEFDDCIEEAKSFHSYQPPKSAIYSCRKDAILHALELEKQAAMKKNKRPGHEFQTTVCRSKRSRCVYLPAQSSNFLKSTNSDSKSLSYVAGESTLSCSTEPRSFITNIQKQGKYKSISHALGLGAQKCKPSIQFLKSGRQVVAAPMAAKRGSFSFKNGKDEIGTDSTMRVRERSTEEIHHGRAFGNAPHGNMQPVLIDVELTVQASERVEPVPLVWLMSRSSRTSVIGRPIEVEALDDSHFVQKNTRKRPLKKHKFHDQYPREHKSAVEKKHLLSSMKGRLFNAEANITSRVACVPVRLVFSRLHEAVGS